MGERSIVYDADEVRLLLAGETVELRRAAHVPMKGHNGGALINVVPSLLANRGDLFDARHDLDNPRAIRCPFGVPGARLWVKETWAIRAEVSRFSPVEIAYRAESEVPTWHAMVRPMSSVTYAGEIGSFQWRSSIHMPRWASGLTITIDAVRCERSPDGKRWEWVLVAKRAEVRDG